MFDLIFFVTIVIKKKKIFNGFDISKIDEKKSGKKFQKTISYDRIIKSIKKKF